MGVQLIFAVETNQKSKSDWIYIKDTIDRFYSRDEAHIKLTPVYMGGKTKYEKKEKDIKNLISEYKGKSFVIYCFDCDDYDTNPDEANFLEKVRRFCEEKDYKFVWFCKDIERVYLERKVEENQKKKEAEHFKAKKLIENIKEEKLSSFRYSKNTSNILKILDEFNPFLVRKK